MTWWTESRVENLKAMWRAGMVASQIGERLGCSRNAVLGKLFRLKMLGRMDERERARRSRNGLTREQRSETMLRWWRDKKARAA